MAIYLGQSVIVSPLSLKLSQLHEVNMPNSFCLPIPCTLFLCVGISFIKPRQYLFRVFFAFAFVSIILNKNSGKINTFIEPFLLFFCGLVFYIYFCTYVLLLHFLYNGQVNGGNFTAFINVYTNTHIDTDNIQSNNIKKRKNTYTYRYET